MICKCCRKIIFKAHGLTAVVIITVCIVSCDHRNFAGFKNVLERRKVSGLVTAGKRAGENEHYHQEMPDAMDRIQMLAVTEIQSIQLECSQLAWFDFYLQVGENPLLLGKTEKHKGIDGVV